MAVLAQLEPKAVFHYFEEICGIPHESSDTQAISDYLVAFAKERNLYVRQDTLGNVIIKKPATSGYEDAPVVMLQGHMDMVCEKTDDKEIDFHTQGLDLVLEGNVIHADRTTLGGDDGIAVAFALAILDASNIPHPALEVVITVDEEIGMLGAAGITTEDLQASYMLNLDSEDEGQLLVGCAGGMTAVCHMPIVWEACNLMHPVCMQLSVDGLLGGHSGGDHQRGRPVSCKYRERRNDPQPAVCYTAYQRVRLTCGTVLQPGNHAGRKRTEAADQPQAETLSRAVFTDHRGSD